MVAGVRPAGLRAVTRCVRQTAMWLLCIFLVTFSMSLPEAPNAARAIAAPAQTVPPDVLLARPTPAPLVFRGQVIDLENGYVVFSTGDALKVAVTLRVLDATTGTMPTYSLQPGFFAMAIVDASSGHVVELRTSMKPLTGGADVAEIPRHFVVAASSPKPNPDIAPSRAVHTGVLSKTVAVSLSVAVPPNTPFSDDVYVASDTSGWNAQAIKMQRIDGLHFAIQLELHAGTQIHYLFTRGSWDTVERERSGLQRKARTLFVPGGDAQVIDATVQRWLDLQ